MKRSIAAFWVIFVFTVGGISVAAAQEKVDEGYEIKDTGRYKEQMYDERDYQEDYGDPAEGPADDDWGKLKSKRIRSGWGEEESNAPSAVIVKDGDTLWDLCSQHLGNPWYWQKIWKNNPQIDNAHWIYPGNKVYFSSMDGMGTMVGSEGAAKEDEEMTSSDELGHIPDIMTERDWGEVSEGGKYIIKDYFTSVSAMGYDFYNFRRDGFIAYRELKHSGDLSNSPVENIFLSEGDAVYLKPKKDHKFKLGQKYQIFRSQGEVEHPVTGDDLGVKIEILGQCEVLKLSKHAATARITKSYGAIERGDKIRPWKNPVRDIRPRRNKVGLQGYIVEKQGGRDILSEHEIVYLDKGVSHGVEEGNRMFVIRKMEPSGYDDGLEKDELPFEKIGELVILSAGHQTSVAMVAHSLTGLKIGDKVVMEKNY